MCQRVSSMGNSSSKRSHRNELATRVLAAALLRHIDNSALKHLEQGLLHALPADVSGDADVLTPLHNLVNLHEQSAPASANCVVKRPWLQLTSRECTHMESSWLYLNQAEAAAAVPAEACRIADRLANQPASRHLKDIQFVVSAQDQLAQGDAAILACRAIS